MLRKALTTVAAAAFVCGLTLNASAQQRSDRAVYFTFDHPVAIPGHTLEAGKYLFKLLDSQTNRYVVQVFNADGTKLVTMAMTIPAQRMDLPDDPQVQFMEGPANTPPAIRTWWYPAMKTGWEFIYPRSEAMKLAANAKEPILTTKTDVNGDAMKDAELTRLGANGDAAVEPTPEQKSQQSQTPPAPVASPRPAAPPPAPTPTVTPSRTPDTTPQADATRMSASNRTDLPTTASETPMAVLVGVIALFGALIVHRRRRLA